MSRKLLHPDHAKTIFDRRAAGRRKPGSGFALVGTLIGALLLVSHPVPTLLGLGAVAVTVWIGRWIARQQRRLESAFAALRRVNRQEWNHRRNEDGTSTETDDGRHETTQ